MTKRHVGSALQVLAPTATDNPATRTYVDAAQDRIAAVISNNMILDPNFEDASTWSSAKGSMVTSGAHSGTSCRMITADGTGFTANRLCLTRDHSGAEMAIVSAEDSLYQIEVYLKKGASNHTGGGVRLEVVSIDNAGTETSEETLVITQAELTTSWQYFQLLAHTTSSTAVGAKIVIGIDPATTVGDTFYVDTIYTVDLSWFDIGMELAYKTLGVTNWFYPADNQFTIVNATDNTKRAVFDASAITTGQTRILKLPDRNTNLVGHDTTDVLTNKDLTSVTNVFPTLNQNTTGNAATATVLATSRNLQTNLASTAAVAFNGSAAVSPGVTGTLPVGNGGTGAATLTGLVKGNGTSAMTAATAGTDYVAPSGALGTPSSGTLTNCSGLPASGLTATTTTAVGFGTIELGHASDTTLSRLSAGVVAVEGIPLATTRVSVNSQSGTTYTLALTDASKTVELTNASTVTLTVPTNATVAFSSGDVIELWQGGAGQVVVTPAGGVTILSTSSKLKLTGQYSGGYLRYRGSDSWTLVGDLSA